MCFCMNNNNKKGESITLKRLKRNKNAVLTVTIRKSKQFQGFLK